MDVRRAIDGKLYTEQEFLEWYGPTRGRTDWESAGAQEPGATRLVPEAQQPARPPSHPAPPPNQQPADGTAQQLAQPPALPQDAQQPAGAQEPGATKLFPEAQRPAGPPSHPDPPPNQQPADDTTQQFAQPPANFAAELPVPLEAQSCSFPHGHRTVLDVTRPALP